MANFDKVRSHSIARIATLTLGFAKDKQQHFEIRQPGDNFRKLDFEPNVSIISCQHPVKSELLKSVLPNKGQI